MLLITRLLIRLILLIGYILWRMWLWLWLITCLAILAIALLFPRLPEYRAEIEQWLNIVLAQPIRLGKIDTFWLDGLPTISLFQIEFLDPQTQKSLASVAHLQVSFDLLASLRTWQVITRNASIRGSQLSLIHQADGSVILKGLPTITTTDAMPTSTDPPQLLQWLLQQSYLSIHATTLTLLEPKQPPLHLANLQVTIHTQGTEHWISGTTELPKNVVQGVRGGLFTFELLTTWKKTRLLGVKGTFSLTEAQFVSTALQDVAPCNPPTCQLGIWGFLLPQMSGRIQATQQINGMWQVIIKDLLLKDQQQRWLLSEAKWYIIPTPHFFQIVGSATEIDLGKLLNWINELAGDTNPNLRETIAALHLQGKLHDIRWQYVAHETNKWRFRSRFSELAMESQGELPAVRDLSGEMDIHSQGGSLDFTRADLNIQANSLYTHPLALQQVNGTVRWEQKPEGWQVYIKELQAIDLQKTVVKANGYLLIPNNSTVPQSDITISLSKTNMTQVPYYIPDKVLSDLHQWLSNALVTGLLHHVELKLQGPVDQLFSIKKPTFQLLAQVKNVTLDYAKGFPKLQQLDADLSIKNNKLTIKSTQGKIFNSRIQSVAVTIDNLTAEKSTAVVDGKINGQAADGLRYVKESPLNQEVNLDDVDIKGAINLQLDLQIPLYNKSGTTKGIITFKDATVQYRDINAIMHKVNGEFHFSENGIFTQNLAGQVFDKKVNLEIKTLEKAKPARLRVQLTGQADSTFLAQQLPQLSADLANLPIYDHLTGTMQWQTTIEVISAEKTTELHFEADLTNMAIELPQPLGKIKQEKQILSFTTKLTQQEENNYLRFRYGEILNGIFTFDQQGIERGTLVFGTELAQLTSNTGLRFIGQMPTFTLTDWLPFIATEQTNSTPLDIILNVTVDNFILFEQPLKNVHLQTEYLHSHLRFAITGENIEGNIVYDGKKDNELLNIAFNRLYIKLPTQANKKEDISIDSLDPRTLPKINFYCRNLAIQNNQLGVVKLNTTPTQHGLSLNATAKTKYAYLQIQGQWSSNQHSTTQLTALLTSHNTGQMLKQFGFQKSPIEGGSTEIQLQADWSDAPYAVKIDKINGKLDILLKSGEIVDVDPGVGRLFGLFDLHSLPQRLSLDFRDIFNKGFAFTTIAGNFTIKEGNAYTENTILQGPAAHIKFQGRTGLVAHDYEQTVTVIPHISSTLPVAGALVGGLGIGAIALIIQTLMQEEIENAMRYEYSITGSWENPVINPIIKEIDPKENTNSGFPLSRYE